VRLLSRFVYRAPLLAVGEPLVGPMAQLALALHKPAPAAKASYARRAAFRATPHGLWAGVGMGELGERTRAHTGPMRASITVAYARLWQAARARLDDAGVLNETRLRVAPSLLRDELTATWLAFGEDAESESRAAEIDDVLAGVLDGAADWIDWRELRDAAGVDDEFLLMLVDDGLLLHDGAPPLVGPPPLTWMAARHDEWAERAELLAAPTPAALEALSTLDDPLHAVLVHEGEVTLSRAAVERAAALAPLLFRLQQALTPPFDERALQSLPALESAAELYGAGAFRLDGLALGHYGTPLDAALADEPRTAVAAVQRVILDAIVGALVAGAPAAALDGAALDAVAPAVATPPTFELMLAPARERRGAQVGDGWLVGLHAPAGASWGRFAHAVGAPLVAALGELAEAEPTAAVDVAYAPSPRLGDLCAHPPLRRAALALSDWPAGAAVTPADLALDVDPARPLTLQLDGAPVSPSPLWRVRSTTAPRGLPRLLTGFALTRQHAPWALSLGALGDLGYVPRLTLDGFVVAPASWRLPAERTRPALKRWRQSLNVPRHVQVGHEDELLLVDLDARDAAATLERVATADAAANNSDGSRVYEVWPPLDSVVDAGGRRLEAIVAVVDEDYVAPEPLAAILPPHTQPAAADWHTFKLFGAADRADRVLVAAIAPLVAAARADGLVDQWFFLRYVDGPGRRDHLRLRVRTADVAPFASALAAALLPARAAGDVVSVERAEYFPERARYGADALAAVERIFEADSELCLALLDDEAELDERLVAVYDALATGAGLDAPARLQLARRRREAYGIGRDDALATTYRARQKALRARLTSPSSACRAHVARVGAALGSLSPARRLELLPPLLHLSAVRLAGAGAPGAAAAFYLWERTLESLARHAER
jgi:thiopeptide-type bacteriocin biosynthesis protein